MFFMSCSMIFGCLPECNIEIFRRKRDNRNIFLEVFAMIVDFALFKNGF